MSPESCNQGAFLIRFPEALQNLPLTSHKIKFNRAILTIILPVCSCLGGRVIEIIIFLLRIALIQNPQEHWDVLYIVRKVFPKGIQRRRDRSKRFRSCGGNPGTCFMDLDPEVDLPLFPCLGIWQLDWRRTTTLDVSMVSHGRGTDFSIQDHYGNY